MTENVDPWLPTGSFSVATAAMLRQGGWTIVEVPAGLTLSSLRRQGAPFRGDRFFREFAPDIVETPTLAHELAYQPGFLKNSLNRRYEDAQALVDEFNANVPKGCRAIIGSAATYVYLFWQHARTSGAFPIPGRYTWSSDRYETGHLVVGVFGRERPLVVAPHLSSGAGIGVMPLIVPTSPGAK